MKYLAIAVAAACAVSCAFYTPEEDKSGKPAIQGTVDRQVEVVRVTMYQSHNDYFFDTQSASGFVKTDDGRLLAVVRLHFQNIQNAADENATELPVGNPSDIAGHQDYGVGITWYETDAKTDDVVYEHGYNEGDGGEVSGVFVVEDTDWSTYVVGRLDAHIDNSGHGVREFDLAWSYGDVD